MGRVLTNKISLAQAIEATLGVLPGSPVWRLLEPNTISTYGATITTVARNPISKLRQRRKGTITDLDSSVEFEHDLTKEAFIYNAEGFAFATFTTVPFRRVSESDTLAAATGPNRYTFATALAGAPAANTLLYARGWTLAANNGLKVVTTGSTTTVVNVTDTLAAETPTAAQHASIEVAGVRGAVGDIQMNGSGNLISTVLDFTTLGLTNGQMIHVGGLTSTNQFATAAYVGYARVVSVTANLITLDKRSWTVGAADNGATKQIDLLFGRFLRNVAVDHASFIERSFQFELAMPGLQNPSGDMYEYSKGNLCNEMVFDLPLTEKATVTFGFIGTDTPPPTATRASGAATPVNPVETAAFNTTSGIARLRILQTNETSITTCFKSLTLTLANNVTPEKCLGTLGASFMNQGNFDVNLEAQLLFTDFEVPTAIRNNTTLTMDFVVKNSDGAIGVDIPSMTLGDGTKEFPVNESVLINVSGEAFNDATLGTSIGISLFPVVP